MPEGKFLRINCCVAKAKSFVYVGLPCWSLTIFNSLFSFAKLYIVFTKFFPLGPNSQEVRIRYHFAPFLDLADTCKSSSPRNFERPYILSGGPGLSSSL